jgi:hypothetical protein
MKSVPEAADVFAVRQCLQSSGPDSGPGELLAEVCRDFRRIRQPEHTTVLPD